MEYASDHYEEVSSEDGKVSIAPPIEHNEPLDVNIPAPGAESPESPAASASPASSKASGQGRVGIEIPLDDKMVAPPLPASPAPAAEHNSDEEAFGDVNLHEFADIFVPSTVVAGKVESRDTAI